MVIARTDMYGFVSRILKYNCIPADEITVSTALVALKYTSNAKDDFDEEFKIMLDGAVNDLFDSDYFSKAYKFPIDEGTTFAVVLTYDKNVQIDASK